MQAATAGGRVVVHGVSKTVAALFINGARLVAKMWHHVRDNGRMSEKHLQAIGTNLQNQTFSKDHYKDIIRAIKKTGINYFVDKNAGSDTFTIMFEGADLEHTEYAVRQCFDKLGISLDDYKQEKVQNLAPEKAAAAIEKTEHDAVKAPVKDAQTKLPALKDKSWAKAAIKEKHDKTLAGQSAKALEKARDAAVKSAEKLTKKLPMSK
ncbi:DUF3801 domain-containing protein [Alloscardovia macacae]|nr:DUF3801 domain-containing protein [Alloscardovia macacae]